MTSVFPSPSKSAMWMLSCVREDSWKLGVILMGGTKYWWGPGWQFNRLGPDYNGILVIHQISLFCWAMFCNCNLKGPVPNYFFLLRILQNIDHSDLRKCPKVVLIVWFLLSSSADWAPPAAVPELEPSGSWSVWVKDWFCDSNQSGRALFCLLWLNG